MTSYIFYHKTTEKMLECSSAGAVLRSSRSTSVWFCREMIASVLKSNLKANILCNRVVNEVLKDSCMP